MSLKWIVDWSDYRKYIRSKGMIFLISWRMSSRPSFRRLEKLLSLKGWSDGRWWPGSVRMVASYYYCSRQSRIGISTHFDSITDNCLVGSIGADNCKWVVLYFQKILKRQRFMTPSYGAQMSSGRYCSLRPCSLGTTLYLWWNTGYRCLANKFILI